MSVGRSVDAKLVRVKTVCALHGDAIAQRQPHVATVVCRCAMGAQQQPDEHVVCSTTSLYASLLRDADWAAIPEGTGPPVPSKCILWQLALFGSRSAIGTKYMPE